MLDRLDDLKKVNKLNQKYMSKYIINIDDVIRKH